MGLFSPKKKRKTTKKKRTSRDATATAREAGYNAALRDVSRAVAGMRDWPGQPRRHAAAARKGWAKKRKSGRKKR